MMLKDDNIYLHDLIKILIDIEMSVMNNRLEKAHYLLYRLRLGNIDEFFSEMKSKVRQKLFELHGEKSHE